MNNLNIKTKIKKFLTKRDIERLIDKDICILTNINLTYINNFVKYISIGKYSKYYIA